MLLGWSSSQRLQELPLCLCAKELFEVFRPFGVYGWGFKEGATVLEDCGHLSMLKLALLC